MLPFRVDPLVGSSPYRQIVYSATRAIVAGELTVGSPFPSVRTLSQSLKVNPNTAQRAVAELQRAGLLEVRAGVGTVVADWGPASPGERKKLLSGELEKLIVEGRRLGVTRAELHDALDRAWTDLLGDQDISDSDRAEKRRA